VRYALTTTVPPAVEPVTLAQAKAQCRVEHDADDALISRLVKAAREMSEESTNRRWITQTVEAVFEGFPCGTDRLALPVGPVQAVTTVAYRDVNGTSQTLSGWEAWEGHKPPVIAPPSTGWPATQSGRLKAVTVTLTAGYATPALVPAHAVQAMLLAVGFWYGFRGDVATEHMESLAKAMGLPTAAEPLLALVRDRGYH
jgi:uncharacterized phiE125 gp8 family phage protein